MTGDFMQGRWPKLMLLGDASAWLAYDIISATEAPRQGLAILQYALLACALCALRLRGDGLPPTGEARCQYRSRKASLVRAEGSS
jgi:hypothetical protein